VAAIFFAASSVSTPLTGSPPLEGLATLLAIRVILSVRQLMCTVSFVPKSSGFYLAMNRDEKLARFTALPPIIANFDSHRTVFPREPNGGTWIAANDTGVCVALINWHTIKREPARSIASRGQVVRAMVAKSSLDEVDRALYGLPLNKLRPFRLIAIVPSAKKVMEWHWDLDQLSSRKRAWAKRHWFSSGFDEVTTQLKREQVCKSASRQNSAGELDWMRRLHRSHLPTRGAFSICMHRSDAATVSYTEVVVSGRHATMRYKSGPSCSRAAMAVKTMALARG
jgi:hypothetical protein